MWPTSRPQYENHSHPVQHTYLQSNQCKSMTPCMILVRCSICHTCRRVPPSTTLNHTCAAQCPNPVNTCAFTHKSHLSMECGVPLDMQTWPSRISLGNCGRHSTRLCDLHMMGAGLPNMHNCHTLFTPYMPYTIHATRAIP